MFEISAWRGPQHHMNQEKFLKYNLVIENPKSEIASREKERVKSITLIGKV